MMKSLLAAAMLLAAQRETTTVEVVQVPVYVSASGAAVSGLTKGDFELFVNGKKQNIDYFDVVDFAALPKAAAAPASSSSTAAPTPPPDPRQRRLYLLLFDCVYSSHEGIVRAQHAAERYLAAAAESDLFAVGTYTEQRGVELVVPFTRDRVVARHAVKTLAARSAADPARLVLEYLEVAEGMPADAVATDNDAGQADPPLVHAAAAELSLDPQRRLITNEIDSLSQLADRLATIEGNRHVVLLSSSFRSSLLHGVGSSNTLDYNGSAVGPRRGSYFKMSAPDATHSLKEMIRHFVRAGVFLDAIDIAGVRTSYGASHDSEGLSTLARDTGGDVVLNHNDLAQAMQHLADVQRVVYTLGFHAHDTGRKENSITVKVRNTPPGASVTYRPGYSSDPPKSTRLDGLRLADILENDIPQAGVTLSASASASGDKTTVDVELPARELLALGNGGRTSAEVLMYVYAGTRAVAFHAARLDVNPRVDTSRPLHLVHDFALPPGNYTAKVLLRVEGSDALGFAKAVVSR
jgi:VWFA-related protein